MTDLSIQNVEIIENLQNSSIFKMTCREQVEFYTLNFLFHAKNTTYVPIMRPILFSLLSSPLFSFLPVSPNPDLQPTSSLNITKPLDQLLPTTMYHEKSHFNTMIKLYTYSHDCSTTAYDT